MAASCGREDGSWRVGQCSCRLHTAPAQQLQGRGTSCPGWVRVRRPAGLSAGTWDHQNELPSGAACPGHPCSAGREEAAASPLHQTLMGPRLLTAKRTGKMQKTGTIKTYQRLLRILKEHTNVCFHVKNVMCGLPHSSNLASTCR